MSLLVADCAYPFDYSILPAGVKAVAGYLGGATPHVWFPAEVTAVTRTGRMWWGIWTSPQRAIETIDGQRDGVATVGRLRQLHYPTNYPVFYDIERHVWDADVHGAVNAISAWRDRVSKAGWTNAYYYGPPGAGMNWLPAWTGHQPPSVPDGAVGVQFAGLVADDRYDLSLFRSGAWDAHAPAHGGSTVALDPTLKTYLDTHFAAAHTDAQNIGGAVYWGTAHGARYPYSLKDLHEKVDALSAAVKLMDTPAVDIEALAESLTRLLLPALGPEIVTALAHQLVKP